LTYGVEFAALKRRAKLVSFSVNKTSSGVSQCKQYGGSVRCAVRSAIQLPFSCATEIRGLLASPLHDQSFLNHSVGSRCSAAGYPERLVALIRIRMSVGPAFAYSITTSK